MNPLSVRLVPPVPMRPSRPSHPSASGVPFAFGASPAVASRAACVALTLGLACAGVQAGTPEGYDAGRRGDYVTALREFQPAAERGDRDAQLALADMYLRGYGVATDPAVAARWFRKAADQGDPRAQTNLGFLYEQGKGVARDFEEAAKW
jgi:TPR repeat protein